MRGVLWILAASGAFAQQRQATPFVLPDDVAMRKVDIMSESTRLGGEVYSLKSMSGKKLPTIVMSHGWGGTVAGLRRVAAAFAQSATWSSRSTTGGRKRFARDPDSSRAVR